MNKTIIALPAVIVLAAVFALAFPLGVATAQDSGAAAPDNSNDKYKDGQHDWKSCHDKEGKTKSTDKST